MESTSFVDEPQEDEPKVEEAAEPEVEEAAEPKVEEAAEPKVEETAEPKVEEAAEPEPSPDSLRSLEIELETITDSYVIPLDT